MKSVTIVGMLLLLLMAPISFAEETNEDGSTVNAVSTVTANKVKPVAIGQVDKPSVVRPIRIINLHGNGITISTEDPFDFMHAKAIIGGVRVLKNNNCVVTDSASAEANSDCFETKRLGILKLDNRVYRLRNVEVSHDQISADIYDAKLVTSSAEDAASNHVGSISVKRYEKPGRDIWAGEMKLEGKEYNAYFLGVKRTFTLSEAKDKISNYCRQHPDAAACSNLNFCKNNPNHERCNPIKEKYCVNNAGDERCRNVLKEVCEKRPNTAFCGRITVAGQPTVAIEPTAVVVEEEPVIAEEIDTNELIAKETLSVVAANTVTGIGQGD